MQSRNEVANYRQGTSAKEGYLVAETIQTGKEQSISLPPPIDVNAPDKADLDIIRAEDIKTITKRQQKLRKVLKKGYTTVYGHYSQDMCNKLKLTVS